MSVKSVKKQNSGEPIEVTIAGYLRRALSAGVMIYLFLILSVMPFYNREGYSHIGSDKSYFFRTYTGYAAKILLVALVPYWCCLLIGFLRRTAGMSLPQRLRMGIRDIHLNITDLFALCYACVVVISYLCSAYQDTALWGTAGWYMGMVPQLMLVGIYFCASRFCSRPGWMIWSALAASAVVYLLGYLNRFDIWLLPMENSGLPEFISTIGNINWYGDYLAALFPMGIGMLLAGKYSGWKRVILVIYVFLGFLAVVTNGSASVLLTLAVLAYAGYCGIGLCGEGDLLRRFWMVMLLLGGAGTFTLLLRALFPGQINLTYEVVNLMTWSPVPMLLLVTAIILLLLMWRHPRRVWQIHRVLAHIALIAGSVCLLTGIGMIVVNTLHPGSLGVFSNFAVFTFNPSWGSARGATWELGARCFGEQDLLHKLVGVGSDCMADYLYGGGSTELYELTKQYFEGRLTNAHSEVITMLVNVGILGAISYIGILISAAIRFLRHRRTNGILLGAGLCVCAYLLNGIWSFQQSMGAATLFAVLGTASNAIERRQD